MSHSRFARLHSTDRYLPLLGSAHGNQPRTFIALAQKKKPCRVRSVTASSPYKALNVLCDSLRNSAQLKNRFYFFIRTNLQPLPE